MTDRLVVVDTAAAPVRMADSRDRGRGRGPEELTPEDRIGVSALGMASSRTYPRVPARLPCS
jgi:hypothetical protein